MYAPHFEYARAGSVQEASSLLREKPEAKLLAGGHSLLPLLKLRTASASWLVDIGRIDELKGVRRVDGQAQVGALTTHAALAASPELPQALSEAAAGVGDWQVRNRGTIGGNVAHADPASDLPTVLTALGATFHLASASGERALPAADFFRGVFETALASDEVLTAIEVPLLGEGSGSAYAKMKNPASGYAMLGAAAVVTLQEGRCAEVRVALGGLTPRPVRAASVEAALAGKAPDASALAAAAQEVAGDLGDFVLGDIHASEEYRRAMVPVYVRRALESAVERAR